MERLIKNILVTGGTGFLGSSLLQLLLERGYRVILLKRSFSDPWRLKGILSRLKKYDIDKVSLENIFRSQKIDVIIHLATDYGRSTESNINGMMRPNIILPAKLLELGVRYKAQAFVNTHTFLPPEYNLYAATKKAFLEIAQYFAASQEIKFINLTLGYIYGEKDDNSKFIPFAIENILKDRKIRATKGKQKRDFLYVKDAARAYMRVLDKLAYLKGGFLQFDIGTGRTLSLKFMLNTIERISGKEAKIEWGAMPYRKNEVFDCKLDTDKARRILDWQPQTSLEEGIKNTISWYKERK